MEKWVYKSPIGDMMILSADEKLKGLWFNDQKYVELIIIYQSLALY